jgi:hypothetical protein
VGHRFETCKYNTNHVFLKKERDSHYENCEFKKKMNDALKGLREAIREG